MKRALALLSWTFCFSIIACAHADTQSTFLRRYCFECHDSDTHKAGLKLDQLAFDLSDRQRSAIWEKIFDKLSVGEMPPKKAEQPPAPERKQILEVLEKNLHDACLARQTTTGRVVLRRLNRTEYENTLRDLLGFPARVADMLPEDGSAAGFDDVAEALSVSSVHLVRYQEAADKALADTIPYRPIQPMHFSRTGKEVFGMGPWFDKMKCWVKSDAIVMPSIFYAPSVSFCTPPAPRAGIYRIRATAYGVNVPGKTLALAFSIRETNLAPEQGDVQAWFDVPGDTIKTVEADIELQPGQKIYVLGWTLPSREKPYYTLKDKPAQSWTGPAIAVEKLEAEGPLDTWPTRKYTALFGDVPMRPMSQIKAEKAGKPLPVIDDKRPDWKWVGDPLAVDSANPANDVRRLLHAFLPRAFRRPVSQKLEQYYVDFAAGHLKEGMSFSDAMLATYKAVLCSPHFLFIEEAPGALDDYAIASRLSYFLWKSMPDEILFEAAKNGKLSKPSELHAQVERMLSDPRAQRFTRDFAGQWLDLRKINATTPDPILFPEFDKVLQVSMSTETQMFFDEVLRKDLSVSQFIDSDWTFLNARLAKHYGIDAHLDGEQMQKVKIPPGSHRGGVLTQGSVLKVTADGAHTSPVLRGKWILERILGITPNPPPADVPKIEPDIRGATTIRQQLAKHRSTPACNGCHRLIDPGGFALESFDPAGGWRDFYRAAPPTKGPSKLAKAAVPNYPDITVYRGPDVEIGDAMPDGRPFKDVDEYKRLLLQDPEALPRTLVRKIMTYSTGADVQFSDREVVEQIVQDLRKKNFGFRALVHDVVESRVFLNK